MNVLFIFILLSITEAKRISHDLPYSPNYRVSNPHDYYGSEKFDQAVDFGHVYRDDFQRNYKQKFDRDSDMAQPEDIGNRKKNNQGIRNIPPILKDQPLVFLSPRDELLYHKKYNKSFIQTQWDETKEIGRSTKDLNIVTRPPWYDFSKLLERNLANPLASRRRKVFETNDNRKLNVDTRNFNKIKVPSVNYSSYFESNTFLKQSNRKNRKLDWTTCDEFAKRSVFHPDDVVNTKWLPFYIWSTRDFTSAVIHTFSYPTKKTVQFFKITYAPYMGQLNWNAPKLLLRERRDILLIAGDRRGLFYGVPKQELPSYIEGRNITLPTIKLRLKIHDPYLAMMYCDDNYAVLMAELGTEPHSDQDKTLEASTLKFKGTGKTAHRDLESEVMLAEMEKKKKIEAESRKIIPIEIPKEDLQVRGGYI